MIESQKNSALLNAALREKCKRSLYVTLKTFWDVIIPDDPVYNWHMEYVCDKLQEYGEQVIRREKSHNDLVINIPPGTSKSTIASVVFPVWLWMRDPSIRVITASYSATLSLDLAVKSRRIIKSDLFKELFPDIRLTDDQDTKSYFENTHGGSRSSASVGSSITGKHAHIIIIDDPVDPSQASSNKERETANKWLKETLSTRKVDKKVTPMIYIMQRLHASDPTGDKLKREPDTEHICLPASDNYEVKPETLKSRYINGLLDPVRMDRETLEKEQKSLGQYGYAGQFGQSPSPPEGGIIKKNWFGRFRMNELPDKMTWSFSADTAYTENEDNDPSGVLCYSYYKGNYYIKDRGNVRKEFPDLCRFMIDFVQRNGGDRRSVVSIEPKASGKSLKQTLKEATSLNVIESPSPTKDKVARARDISPIIEAGRVYLLDGAPWVDQFLDLVGTFPNAEHDEDVDCLVIMINRESYGKKIETYATASY